MKENQRMTLLEQVHSQSTEAELVLIVVTASSDVAFVVGKAAVLWVTRHAKGRGDADFGELVGLSGDQIQQRRRVWEKFGDRVDYYRNLKWSHFSVAIGWLDAIECLNWASENEATVAEMKAWRRMQNGEDLTTEAELEYDDAIDTSAKRVDGTAEHRHDTESERPRQTAALSAVTHDPADQIQRADEPYAPFGVSGRDLNTDRTREATGTDDDPPEISAWINCFAAATKSARKMADTPASYLYADHLDRLAECLRQGLTGDKVVGLDRIREMLRQATR